MEPQNAISEDLWSQLTPGQTPDTLKVRALGFDFVCLFKSIKTSAHFSTFVRPMARLVLWGRVARVGIQARETRSYHAHVWKEQAARHRRCAVHLCGARARRNGPAEDGR